MKIPPTAMETKQDTVVSQDTVGAFIVGPALIASGRKGGSLEGLSFAVKDLIDVEGYITGAGNPDFAAAAKPATRNAPVVQTLLDAGADLVGKTITDELAWSLNGTNVHYGTPQNVAARGRIPGGSSSGSAAAVAAGIVSFALGTDTGGSVRVPASYCGLFGLRPTHGRLSSSGVFPFAPSLDTVGVLAPSGAMLRLVTNALLGAEAPARVTSICVVDDVLALVDGAVASSVNTSAQVVATSLGLAFEHVSLGSVLAQCASTFRTLQGAEAWAGHGEWIRRENPSFGPGVAQRVEYASTVDEAAIAAARLARRELIDRVDLLTCDGKLLAVPSAASVAPRIGSVDSMLRIQTLTITSIASLAGVPAISVPFASIDGLPLGLSLIGLRGSDEALVRIAQRFEHLVD